MSNDLPELNQDFFVSLFSELEDPLFVKDSRHRWIFFNTAFQKLLGIDDVLGKTDSDIFPEEQYLEFYAGDDYVINNQRSLTQEEKIGSEIWGLVKKTPIKLPNGEPGILCIIIDITEYRTMRTEVETLRLSRRQALHDHLTDLPNRRQLEEYFHNLSSENCLQTNCCLLHLDLDGFKSINDDNGHAAGDAVLIEISRRLESYLLNGMIAARIGGDEFVILGRFPGGITEAKNWSEGFASRVREPIGYEGKKFRIGCCIGIASVKDVSFDLNKLMRSADIALYTAKENGKNRVEVYTEELGKKLRDEKIRRDSFLSCLSKDNFLPYYQPQFNIQTGEYSGVEALARWKHPTKGLVGPNEFIDLFESYGRLDELDIMVLDKTLKEVEKFSSLNFDIGRIAINMSSTLLHNEDLVEIFRSRTPFGVKLSIELSETISLENLEEGIKVRLDSLQDLGCEIEIDDFGSNRASLASLLTVLPDRLKIDKKLIIPMTKCSINRVITQSILQIANELNVPIVAEGVETEEHLVALRKLGCKFGQGFYLAPPMSAEALVEFFRNGCIGGKLSGITA